MMNFFITLIFQTLFTNESGIDNLYFFLFFAATPVLAQMQVANNGFENWSGTTLNSPANWVPIETALGLRFNKFVFKDSLSENVNSGSYSVKLFSDTSSVLLSCDSPCYAGLSEYPGAITYGQFLVSDNCANPVSSGGLPVNGKPSAIGFAIKVNHPVNDSAYWVFSLTRWNSFSGQEDIVAQNVDLFQDPFVPENQWFWVFDSINYLLPAEPDTLHLFITGGARGYPERKGNTTWIDDMSLFYTGTGVVHLDPDDAVRVFPNPTCDFLNVQVDDYMKGNTFTVFDLMGQPVIRNILFNSSLSINVTGLHSGVYFYKLTDMNGVSVYQGNFDVVR